jgi:hypothetical protein
VQTTRLFGVRRRIWRVRRSAPRIARPLSRVLPRFDPPVDPIFVLGCPRSGTSVLLEGLLQSGSLRSVQTEGHILWDEFHHPSDRGWDSDALSGADVSERERQYVYCAVALAVRGSRFVDKTPENCLRVSYLAELFPDARFVFLRRRAADNVNSLIEAWRARPRFVKYRLPEPLEGIAPLDGARWSLVLVPGWRELRRAALEEICARQYVACNEAVLEARAALEPSTWVDVTYEDLLRSPIEELARIYGSLQLEFGPRARRRASELADRPTRTALTRPRADKWREQNAEAIARVLPRLLDLERRLGYGSG